MTTKHSPLIRLQAAINAVILAEQDCAHWDYEDDGDAGLACCDRLHSAKRELRLAREAAKAA